MCPVCGKKVGSWHKSGMHPACEKKERRNGHDEISRAIGNMSQPGRDAILRRINGTPRER